MINEFPFLILREFIIRITNYESITNLRLVNKRSFKFINDDLVIQKYYLKLRYNLKISRNTNFPKLIQLLDSKCYSKFIKQGYKINSTEAIFVNPSNDYFVFCTRNNGQVKHVLLLQDDPVARKIGNIFLQNKEELLEESMCSEGYFLFDQTNSIFEHIFTDVCGTRHGFQIMGPEIGTKICLRLYSETFNQRIITKLKTIKN